MEPAQFGRFLTEERKNKNLTQKELAEKLGVSDKAVSKWERGICLPDVAKFDDIAAALDLTDIEVLRAHRIPLPETPPPPEWLLTRRHVGRLLPGWLGVAVVCFVGNMLEVWGVHQIIGLFSLGQAVLAAVFGLWYGWRVGPARRLSVHSAYLGCIAIAALILAVILEMDHFYIIWGISDRFLGLFIPVGPGHEDWLAWRMALLNGPELWPPKFLLVKFVCYELLDIWSPMSLLLEFAAFLLIRRLRTFALAMRRKRGYNKITTREHSDPPA